VAKQCSCHQSLYETVAVVDILSLPLLDIIRQRCEPMLGTLRWRHVAAAVARSTANDWLPNWTSVTTATVGIVVSPRHVMATLAAFYWKSSDITQVTWLMSCCFCKRFSLLTLPAYYAEHSLCSGQHLSVCPFVHLSVCPIDWQQHATGLLLSAVSIGDISWQRLAPAPCSNGAAVWHLAGNAGSVILTA